jgi:hypothetical protein
VLTSTDKGINWTPEFVGTYNGISDISCRNNRCIVIGSWGTILTKDNVNVTCEPASYSKQTQQAYLPTIEIPLFDTLNLYSANLTSSNDFFRMKGLIFQQKITTANPCHAIFMPNTGILTIPRLQLTEEPEFTCTAILQQSLLQSDVLSLIKYNCWLP